MSNRGQLGVSGFGASRLAHRGRRVLLAGLLSLSCTDVVPLGSWSEQQPVILPPLTTTSTTATPTVSMPDAAVPVPTGTVTQMPEPSGASDPPLPLIDAGQSSLDAGRLLDASIGELDAGDAGAPMVVMPACNALAEPGELSARGVQFASTETSTDWTWSSSADSIQWDMMIENEIDRPSDTSPGYYWHQQFSFVQGVTVIIGLQAGGKYEANPSMGEVEWTKMAVFWLSGPPIDAELGDIEYPDARISEDSAVGLNWKTIHAKFEWEACHVYQVRFAPDFTEAGGAIWYGAWITDRTTSVTTFLGRMLVPADAGEISLYSISRTSPILPQPAMACLASPHASAIFGKPTAVDGSRTHAGRGNRFTTPTGCRQSRFTDFEDAVRHELSVE